MMKETLSALMDGELPVSKAAAMIKNLSCDDQLRRTWDYYHLTRDALRDMSGSDQCVKLHARLATEPTIIAPQPKKARLEWRLFLSSAAATVSAVAGVAFVGGMVFGGLQQRSPTITAPLYPNIGDSALLAEEGTNQYLFAHQLYSPQNAILGVAFYKHAPDRYRNAKLK